MAKLHFLKNPWFYFGGVLFLYSILLLPTINRQGISWDEQNDLWVAQSYLVPPDGWLAGSDVDPSQTRLPMFAVALVYRLLDTSDLITARWVSCLVGGLTLLAVYLYCKERYKPSTGILACLLLATSPFFLSFARVAFTETDIYLACTLAWLLICVARLQARPTLGWAAMVGLVLGLSLSAKFTALAALPAVWYVISQSQISGSEKGLPQVKDSWIYFWTAWSLAFSLGGIIVAARIQPESGLNRARLVLFLLVFLGWVAPLVWSALRRSSTASRLALAAFVTGFALLTFLVIPPEHLTNPAILQSLSWRAKHEMACNPGFMFEAAGLHFGSLIFKSGPLIGLGMLVGFLLTAIQWRRKPEARFPTLLILLYFGGLILLPLAQTF